MSAKFLIGAATAPHQVEGNNINSDYWVQENLPFTTYVEPSGITCDHYHRYEEDIRLLSEAGLNAYRFGVEWARIQPTKDTWDEEEIEHYRNVIKCCKKYNITPIVTMHHFSSPKWLIGLGGWESEEVISLFTEYCKKVVCALGKDMEYVCTINEANMGMQLAAMIKDLMKKMGSGMQVGVRMSANREAREKFNQAASDAFGCPPDKINTFLSSRTPEGDAIVFRAHESARDAIKQICPHIKVGVTLSLHDYQLAEGGEENIKNEWDMEFTHYLPYIKNDDFLGVQCYTRKIMGKDGVLLPEKSAPLTQMNYEDYPQAIGNVVKKVAKDYKGEIIVTENGISTDDDERRKQFIDEAVSSVKVARAEGVNVTGYMYWSLMDNFEWQKGYGPKFGLIAVNRKTMERTPKGSLKHLGSKVAE